MAETKLVQKYLNYICSLPCFVCGAKAEACKIDSSDFMSTPLCDEHGKELAEDGGDLFADFYVGDMNVTELYQVAMRYLVDFLEKEDLRV